MPRPETQARVFLLFFQRTVADGLVWHFRMEDMYAKLAALAWPVRRSHAPPHGRARELVGAGKAERIDEIDQQHSPDSGQSPGGNPLGGIGAGIGAFWAGSAGSGAVGPDT